MSRRRALLDEATQVLTEAGVESARADAEWLMCHVTDVPRSLLFQTPSLDEAQCRSYRDLIAARADRTPLQHLLGSAAFRYVEVEVGPGVFVPRSETELLAGWAIEAASAVNASPVIVDLGTGSGAIALAIADEVPTARLHAVERDRGALEWAERNLTGTGVDLHAGDMATAFGDLDGTVDVVVANPPYIPLGAWEGVAAEARDYDPALALWSGEDGMDALRVVEQVAWRLLRPGGVVGAEHADSQAEAAPAVFADRWSGVADHRDLAGRPRFVTARKPG